MTTLRIIDANGNRAREALRVLEDAARFLLDAGDLSGDLKRSRHEIAALLQQVDGLEAHRDTPGDVGTEVSTPTEMTRRDARDVVAAAGKRAGEALRAIEEYGKLLPESAALSASTERLRYRVYELERQVLLRMGSGRRAQWRLCVLLTEALCADGHWQAVAEASVGAGCDCLQLREKTLDDRTLLDRARWLARLCRDHNTSFVVNDRPDIALLSGADGVHLGQGDLACLDVRRLSGAQLAIGVSTSCLEQAQAAIEAGADYCGIGPMFPTTTKKKHVIVGPDYAARFLATLPGMPHLAIGGIHAENVATLTATGVRGIAVSSAVCSAKDPAAATHLLLQQMEAVKPAASTADQ